MFATASWAQDTPVVRGHFLSDTTGISEVPFALTARYNRDLQMLFRFHLHLRPESPSEKYATTRTEGNQSYDSVVYPGGYL